MLKSFKLLIFVACLLTYQFVNAFDNKELQRLAVLEGFGYKSANLILLKSILNDPQLKKSIEPIKVKVPEFLPISSRVIRDILATEGIHLPSKWNEILKISQVKDSILRHSFSSEHFPRTFFEECKKLSSQIKESFLKISKDPLATKTFSSRVPELEEFIGKAQQQMWRLMIRSTGKEDTEELANAGGNKSMSNISPDISDILNAIGEVIRSYFEEKSLSQRIGGKDKTIFDLPLTPVLVQKMVGEKMNGEDDVSLISTGCVLYTEEANARLLGLHTAQCSFGHNEGVVQNMVPLDTFFIDKDYIEGNVKVKENRVIPFYDNGVFGLKEINNPKSLVTKPSLSDIALKSLGSIATKIDSAYDKRMDIELAYSPLENTFYIFQARPIVALSMDSPSYVHDFIGFNKDLGFSLDIVSSGDNKVNLLKSNTILFAKTLEEALTIYTKPGYNRDNIEIVLAEKKADPTSHAAATFRGEGKAIFISADSKKLSKLLREEKEWLLDKQRGFLISYDDSKYKEKGLEDLYSINLIKKGFVQYPLPLLSSVGVFRENICTLGKGKTEFIEHCAIDETEEQIQTVTAFVNEQRKNIAIACEKGNYSCLLKSITSQIESDRLEATNTHLITLEEKKSHQKISLSFTMIVNFNPYFIKMKD